MSDESPANGVLYGLRNPAVLLSPLTTQEAVLSSRIEGTQATLGDVLKFEAGEEPDQESRHAETALTPRPFSLNLLLELHGLLSDSGRGVDKVRGRFRTVQNWIGTTGRSTTTATDLARGTNG